jgi:hypothetical protein
MNSSIYVYIAVGVALLAVVVVVGYKHYERKRKQLLEHLGALAAEVGFVSGYMNDTFYGNLMGWPVTLELTDISAYKQFSVKPKALEMVALAEAAMGKFVEASQTRSLARRKKPVIALTIDGKARPQELDRLVGLAMQWEAEAEGWELLVAGDQRLRWIQDLRADQTAVRGMPVARLLSKTLGAG